MIFSDYEEPELKDRSDEMGQLIAYVLEQQKHNSNTEQPEVHHESKEEVTANVAIVDPATKSVSTSKNKLNIVPSNSEYNYILHNDKLSNQMMEDICKLHDSNKKQLESLIFSEMDIVDKIVREFLISGNSFDFSWKEYTLRDVVIKQTDDFFEFLSNCKRYRINDDDSLDAIYKTLALQDGHYMTVFLYYGAPNDTDDVLSGVRFIDVMSSKKDGSEFNRNCFIRYYNSI